MKLQMVGCSHHSSSVEVRERLAFSPDQTREALEKLILRFPETEAVLLSTCNRTELYVASGNAQRCPSHEDVVDFLATFHGLQPMDIFDELLERTGEDAIRHLFTVASSLDSMVVGEAQILSQVKQAYELATVGNCTGPLTHAAFQASIKVAKRVATETAINQNRVSIPSVAVADFAKGVFERFDDKKVLVIGAGEMGEETLRYLVDEGARDVTIINRNLDRATALAEKIEAATRMKAAVQSWEALHALLVEADLVISTTGASQPIVTHDDYQQIDHERFQKPLFILDLAVPRDFDPAIREHNVYLYSIDDLAKACEANRRKREKEWPKAQHLIETETERFMTEWRHRATGPTIRRLKQRADELKDEELLRLLNKLSDDIPERDRREIQRSFDRLVNKILHPPLESLRDEAQQGTPHGLLEALKRLFQIKD